MSLAERVRDLLSPQVTAPLLEVWHGPYTAKRAKEWIHDRDAEGITLLVTSKETRECVGLVLLHESRTDRTGKRELRLGYLIAESQWGRGYATELVGGVVRWARGRSYDSVVAGVSGKNVPSLRVLEKCGFSRAERDAGDGTEHFYRIDL